MMVMLQLQRGLSVLFLLVLISSWILPFGVCLSPSSSPTTSRAQQQVIVVGGGVGGLAVAARIAASSSDTQVTVLEKNAFVGGRCGSFDITTSRGGTFRHERGPSLLLLKQVYQDLFEDCTNNNKSMQDYGLVIKQCIPAYQVVFDDGDTIELGFPTDAMECYQEALQQSRDKMDSYELGGARKWDEYMQCTAAFLDCGLPNFIEERLDLASFPAFLREALREGAKAWPLKPHSDVLDATFDSQKLKALASFQNLYVGLEPFRNDEYLAGGVLRKTAPAVFGLLAAIELHPSNKNAGVFAPVGGFRAVQTAFRRLAEELGVEIRLNTTVTQVDNDGVHVRSNDNKGESLHVPADLVVVNADLPYATETILSDDSTKVSSSGSYDWDDSFDFSSGVIAFHWCIDKVLDDLNTHNVFLVANSRSEAKASWRVLRPNPAGDSKEVEPFNFYVHRASKTDPTAAPDGRDSLLVLVPCKTLDRKKEYAQLPREEAIALYKEQFDERVISKARQAVLKRLAVIPSLQNLETHILDQVVDTPGTYADYYNVGAGTPFALSHGFRQLSLTRPGAESLGMPHVLFVGASSRPGNGVPLVLMGAKQVAEKALSKLKLLAT